MTFADLLTRMNDCSIDAAVERGEVVEGQVMEWVERMATAGGGRMWTRLSHR